MNITASRRFVARSDNQCTAQLVGCHPSKVRLLVQAGLLYYLNGDVPGAVKYTATIDLLERSAEPKWQVHATRVLAGQSVEAADLGGRVRKPRARGLQQPGGTDSDVSLTGNAVREQFLAGLMTGPDGQPVPALLGDALVARILGFRTHDLAPLRSLNLLKADNGGLRSAKKLHSREYILSRALDVDWLEDATRAINDYWKRKNARKGLSGAC